MKRLGETLVLCAALGLGGCRPAEHAPAQAAAPAAVSHYTCSMHPAVHAAHPGVCPICGMDLVPVSRAEAATGVVRVDPRRLEWLGVRFAEAARAPLVRTLHALGRVTHVAPDGTWIDAELPGSDRALVSVGQRAAVRAKPLLGRPFAAVVVDIRNGAVRLRYSGADPALRPGTWVDLDLPVELGERVSVPRSAVIVAGSRRIVFVDAGEGRLEPRSVAVGLAGDERVEIQSGVAAGERVVTSGTFLIAAESRVHSALEQW